MTGTTSLYIHNLGRHGASAQYPHTLIIYVQFYYPSQDRSMYLRNPPSPETETTDRTRLKSADSESDKLRTLLSNTDIGSYFATAEKQPTFHTSSTRYM